MKKEENVTDLALASAMIVNSDDFDLATLPVEEQLRIIRAIRESDAELESMALPQFKSEDIIGRALNILDACHRSIPVTEDQVVDGTKQKVSFDKVCVSFVCEFAEGDKDEFEQFTVLKGSNSFNDAYVQRFSVRRGIQGANTPLQGFEFVRDSRYNKAGNDAIIVQRIRAKAATKK